MVKKVNQQILRQFLCYIIINRNRTMGNCTGAKSHSKPIQSLGKENLENIENVPPHPMARTNSTKVTIQQANKKRQALKNYLTEGNLEPPKFFIHKIEPISTKYCKN